MHIVYLCSQSFPLYMYAHYMKLIVSDHTAACVYVQLRHALSGQLQRPSVQPEVHCVLHGIFQEWI